ncbi:AraC family transcriptional regulator [uncultured Algibacter sp.]|uniref:helix-turn-helix domain-containing protein n=1 Tax=uncultured Algibacter sp. TaxID=298659 RepID=UPI0026088E80|nr:AraC family transcriptional regulator [uncultured Algibacter sp.]
MDYFLNGIVLITSFLMLFFAFFLITVNIKKKLPNILFASFLILSVFDISSLFIFNSINSSLNFEVFRMTISLLILPIYYLYVKSVCYSDFQLSTKDLIHSILFLIVNLILIPRFYLGDTNDILYISQNFKQTFEIRFFYILKELQYAFYIFLIYKSLKKYKNIYAENHTNSNNSSYTWLFQMTLLLLIAHCFIFIKLVFVYTGNDQFFNWFNSIIGISALIISSWFVLKALKKPKLFKGIDTNMIALNKEIAKKAITLNKKPIHDSQKLAEMTSQVSFVKQYILDNELFLEPSLTIQEVSKQVNIPVRDLSLLINRYSNQHFFDFINEFRIEKAKQLMKSPSNKELTILEILYQVGFNSKSSFNTAFKKFTNQTPTTFRNN